MNNSFEFEGNWSNNGHTYERRAKVSYEGEVYSAVVRSADPEAKELVELQIDFDGAKKPPVEARRFCARQSAYTLQDEVDIVGGPTRRYAYQILPAA